MGMLTRGYAEPLILGGTGPDPDPELVHAVCACAIDCMILGTLPAHTSSDVAHVRGGADAAAHAPDPAVVHAVAGRLLVIGLSLDTDELAHPLALALGSDMTTCK